MAGYLKESGRELADVYKGGRTSWSGLLRSAGMPGLDPGPDEAVLAKRLHRFTHVDGVQRIDQWSSWLRADSPPDLDNLIRTEQLLARMLFFTFWRNGGSHATYADGLLHLWEHPAIIAELLELLAVRRNQIDHLPIDPRFRHRVWLTFRSRSIADTRARSCSRGSATPRWIAPRAATCRVFAS